MEGRREYSPFADVNKKNRFRLSAHAVTGPATTPDNSALPALEPDFARGLFRTRAVWWFQNCVDCTRVPLTLPALSSIRPGHCCTYRAQNANNGRLLGVPKARKGYRDSGSICRGPLRDGE
jgi:hypothetical protein